MPKSIERFKLSNSRNAHGVYFLIIIGLVIFALPGNIYAEYASEAEMEQVCRNWLIQHVMEKGAWGKAPTPQIMDVHEITYNGRLLARCYSIWPQGFILVPAVKELPPVKAYSTACNLDVDRDKGFMALIKEILISRMEIIASANERLSVPADFGKSMISDPAHRDLWDVYTLTDEDFSATISNKDWRLDEAGPLVTSRWHQGPPYWNNCPADGNGQCLVGCLATAMAQVLYYWKWPNSGYGSHSYTWYNFLCGFTITPHVISADFSDEYDWDNMPDSCIFGCTSVQQQALAELNYEVSISLHSEYGSCVTGAEISPWAYIINFMYSDKIKLERRRHYDTEGWFAVIRGEIDNNRPIQYTINNHSIICDGYRDHGNGLLEYHMNYGWANSFDTWYVLDNLPCPWCPGGFSPIEQEYMVTHIEPQTQPFIYIKDFELLESEGNGDGEADPGETLTLAVTIENMGVDVYHVLGEIYTDDPYIDSFGSPGAVFDTLIPHGGQSTQSLPFSISINEECPDPRVAIFEFSADADGGYAMIDSIYVFIGNTAGLTEDFENGRGLWDHHAFTIGADDEWHLETFRAHSEAHSWKAGGNDTDTYSCVQDACLITPPFMLPDHAELTFWHWIDSEIGGPTEKAWDGGIVMISTSGQNWIQIYPEGGYPYEMIEYSGNLLGADTPCFSGSHDWKQETFDLSDYSGTAQIMFRFGTDAANTAEGWYIDDVKVSQGYTCGDATGDLLVNVSDAVYIINYVFAGGFEPDPYKAGDVNCDETVNVSDAVYIINYVFVSGDNPCDCE